MKCEKCGKSTSNSSGLCDECAYELREDLKQDVVALLGLVERGDLWAARWKTEWIASQMQDWLTLRAFGFALVRGGNDPFDRLVKLEDL